MLILEEKKDFCVRESFKINVMVPKKKVAPDGAKKQKQREERGRNWTTEEMNICAEVLSDVCRPQFCGRLITLFMSTYKRNFVLDLKIWNILLKVISSR